MNNEFEAAAGADVGSNNGIVVSLCVVVLDGVMFPPFFVRLNHVPMLRAKDLYSDHISMDGARIDFTKTEGEIHSI